MLPNFFVHKINPSPRLLPIGKTILWTFPILQQHCLHWHYSEVKTLQPLELILPAKARESKQVHFDITSKPLQQIKSTKMAH